MKYTQRDFITKKDHSSQSERKNGSSGWTEVKDIAAATNVDYDLFCTRVYKLGWDAMKAASTPREKRVWTVMVDGVSASKIEHCRRIGVSMSTVRHRMRKHQLDFVSAIQFYIRKAA